MKKCTKKTKFRLSLFSICAISAFSFFVYTLFSNVIQIYNNKSRSDELTEVYNNKLSEEDELKEEIEKLKDPEYLSRYTREKYYYSKDDEIIIKIEE